MQTRRAFLKTILGLGAIMLPWSFLPTRFGEAIKTRLGRPPIELLLPPQIKLNNKINYEILNRTAMDDIYALTAPEMQGRKAGSVGEAKAAEYLASQLSMLGLRPMGDPNTGFIQAFTIPPVVETRVNGRLTFKSGENRNLRFPSINLLGGLMGEQTQEIILLSAHYDHLGVFEERVYPGANDNASGVGCILDVIRRIIREAEVPKRTIVIAFWSAEEMGFVGSQAFVQSPSFTLNQIHAVLNADSVGNGMVGNFALWGDGKNPAVNAIQQAAAKCGASAQLTPRAGHNSDSVSFALQGIPAATLLAQEWLYKNHTPEDTIALVKSEQIYLATEIMYQAVRTLAF
ncbi:M28 family metallopeptidase [Desulfosporosinus nitroreducens]|uniref:M20/M25/M40 family metallo-hydrolase n=1 Tax=Desulfosporosinus nitroreducens TaxID=2018668 RepID=A0ABT8QKH8_9FIRM|nr:M20/M25/M40 family metallo-hydrolase [Desulfosporosinus nitroreducens]MDO0821833.1 M20/M25/M40 family metallo-hydrolase [Desulfosporosinus nitroreducens]